MTELSKYYLQKGRSVFVMVDFFRCHRKKCLVSVSTEMGLTSAGSMGGSG